MTNLLYERTVSRGLMLKASARTESDKTPPGLIKVTLIFATFVDHVPLVSQAMHKCGRAVCVGT